MGNISKVPKIILRILPSGLVFLLNQKQQQKIEKIDPPTKKVGKTIEVLPEDENIKKLYSLLEAILEKRM